MKETKGDDPEQDSSANRKFQEEIKELTINQKEENCGKTEYTGDFLSISLPKTMETMPETVR
jgi:hypothetical protein